MSGGEFDDLLRKLNRERETHHQRLMRLALRYLIGIGLGLALLVVLIITGGN